MSVDILPTISMPPLKRLRSSSPTLSESNITKCGEVFVTNSADKWSFYCSHCQLSTNDIGVFVCHIRLQHLPDQTTDQAPTQPSNRQITIASSRQNVAFITPPPVTSIPMENLLPSEIISAKDNESAEQIQSDIVKEEPTVSINQTNIDYEAICSKVAKIADMSSLAEPESNNETSTSAVINDKKLRTTLEECKQDIFALTEVEQECLQVEIVIKENESEDELQLKADTEAGDGYFLDPQKDTNGDVDEYNEHYIEIDTKFSFDHHNDDQKPNSSSAVKNLGTNAPPLPKKYNCLYCNRPYYSKRGLNYHIKRTHFDNNIERSAMYKCSFCPQTFQTKSVLNFHQKTHNNDRYKYNCTICSLTGFRENDYINHVLLHESDTCYPCQVCGKVATSQEQRMKHWKTHAKEKPYYCRFCYRRFSKQYFLLHHLKTHEEAVL